MAKLKKELLNIESEDKEIKELLNIESNDKEKKTERNYPALNIIVEFNYILGFITIILGIIGIIYGINIKENIKIYIILSSAIFSVFGSISFFGRAEMIKLFIRIEENTRKKD